MSGVLENIENKLDKIEEKIENIEVEKDTKEILNVEEAANYLHMAPSTVYKLINEGDLKYVQVRGRKLIRKEHIDDMLEQKTQKENQNNLEVV